MIPIPDLITSLREPVARIVSGAPFPSKRALTKADAILAHSDLLAALEHGERCREVCIALDKMWTEDIPQGPGEEGDARLFAPETLALWRQARAAAAYKGDPS